MDSANAYIYTARRGSRRAGQPVHRDSHLPESPTALGSVRGIVSSAGALTASTSYDAWGNPQTDRRPDRYTPFGYAGGYTDPTGLLYLINRYYDPSTGQFLSVDPDVSETGEPYSYADGDPVNGTDPLGMWMVGIPSTASRMDLRSRFRNMGQRQHPPRNHTVLHL